MIILLSVQVLLILDEVESVFNHLSSTAVRGKLGKVYETLFSLQRQSQKIICCDAFMTVKTQTVLKRFNGDRSIIYHKNEHHNIKFDIFIWNHNKSPKCYG